MVTRRDSKLHEPVSPTTVHGSAGHVEVDARGNSVWHWTKQSPLDSTTILLQRLENDALEIESSAKLPQPEVAAEDDGRKRVLGRKDARKARGHKDIGGGFDPYNNT